MKADNKGKPDIIDPFVPMHVLNRYMNYIDKTFEPGTRVQYRCPVDSILYPECSWCQFPNGTVRIVENQDISE